MLLVSILRFQGTDFKIHLENRWMTLAVIHFILAVFQKTRNLGVIIQFQYINTKHMTEPFKLPKYGVYWEISMIQKCKIHSAGSDVQLYHACLGFDFSKREFWTSLSLNLIAI